MTKNNWYTSLPNNFFKSFLPSLWLSCSLTQMIMSELNRYGERRSHCNQGIYLVMYFRIIRVALKGKFINTGQKLTKGRSGLRLDMYLQQLLSPSMPQTISIKLLPMTTTSNNCLGWNVWRLNCWTFRNTQYPLKENHRTHIFEVSVKQDAPTNPIPFLQIVSLIKI